jgi:ubiquinone/menaquinone biosynthesis C-methylase UbiE
MLSTAEFWDKIAPKYSKKPVLDEQVYQKKLQITRECFRPDMEIMEFGCGTGSTAIAHAPYVKHIRAVDISSKMIEIAREKADAHHIANITFEQSSIDALTLPDASLDAVLGLSILHLLENKEEVLAKIHRSLKLGGVFVTSTVCLGDKMPFFKLVALIGKRLGLLPILSVFTVKQLETSIRNAGFTIDFQWQPAKSHAVFIVAKKPDAG